MASLYSHVEAHKLLNTDSCILSIFAVPVVEFRDSDAKLRMKVWVKLETSGNVAQLITCFALRTLDDTHLFVTANFLYRRSPQSVRIKLHRND